MDGTEGSKRKQEEVREEGGKQGVEMQQPKEENILAQRSGYWY